VRDVKESLRLPAGLRFYLPDWIAPANVGALLLRLDRDPAPEFKSVVRRAIYDFDPSLITNYVGSIRELIGNAVGAERFTLVLLRSVSAIALGLAAIGLFSVMAYAVNARTHEFGVRLALGAAPASLQRLVLARGIATAGIGLVIGIAAASGLTRVMAALLFETNPYDPWVYGLVGAALLTCAFVACWWPARRAAAVDPMVSLRAE
jgi:putative ABC transport system permease protein